MAAEPLFTDWLLSLPDEDYIEFIEIMRTRRNIFLVEYSGKVKDLLFSATPNILRAMQEFGYRFFFVDARVKRRMQRSYPALNDQETIFDFEITGEDIKENRAVYNPKGDMLILSYEEVVRVFGDNNLRGMLEFDNPKYYLMTMTHVFERFIAKPASRDSDS